MPHRRLPIALVLIVTLAAALAHAGKATPTPTPAKSRPASVKIVNTSKWVIHHIFLSSSKAEEWGPDQLGEDILAKGESVTINGMPCDHYDVKVVDEDDDECEIQDVEMCGDASYWKITDKDLLECEGLN